MTPLYVLLGILTLLVLLALLPVGAEAVYDGSDVRLWLTLWFLKIKLLPRKKKILTEKQQQKAEAKAEKKRLAKAEKQKKKQAQALTAEEKPKKTLKEQIDGILPFVRLVVQLLGTLRRKLLIRRLVIHMRLGGGNAAKTAQTCGYAWGAAGAAKNLLEQVFRVRQSDVQIYPDFVLGKTEIRAEIHLRFLLIDLLAMAVKYGLKALGILIRQKKPDIKSDTTKKAV